jgi:chemotaxis protein MotB
MRDFHAPFEPPEPPRSNRGWMVTFADLLALLLTFFVMLYAMTDVREDEWQSLATAMEARFSPFGPPADTRVPSDVSHIAAPGPRGMDLGYLHTLITAQLEASDVAGDYAVEEKPDGLHIHLPEVILIRQGRVVLTPAAHAAARELGPVLRAVANEVSIEGTASGGGGDAMYASAWEVSLAAAMMVADAIRDAGYERNILALGHGDAYLGEQSGMVNGAGSGSGLPRGQVDIVIRDAESGGENGGT